MNFLYYRLLREFQRLKESPGPGEIFPSIPSIPDLAITWESDVLVIVYGGAGGGVWMLHVPKDGKSELSVSYIQGEEDVPRDMSEEQAESMTATLLEELAKVEA